MSEQRVNLGDLLELIELVCSNVAYSRFVNEAMLIDYKTYFDICQLLFSELTIKIIKVQENHHATPAQKLQQLIDLVSRELEIDKFNISGEEILRGNTDHILRLVEILYECSKIYVESKKPATYIKTEKRQAESDKYEKKPFISDRNPRRSEGVISDETSSMGLNNRSGNYAGINVPEPPIYQHPMAEREVYRKSRPTSKSQKEQSYLIAEKAKKKRPKYSADAKRIRSRMEQSKNVHIQLVKTVMAEKQKMSRTANRDCRKERLSEIQHAKKAYKIFLKRFAKQNKAATNHNQKLKEKRAVRPVSQELAVQDFEVIDRFFESFSYKFRDSKAAFLQRIKKMVRKQQLERYCFQNKLERELHNKIQEDLQQEIKFNLHQHRTRSDILKQKSKEQAQNTAMVKKEVKLRDSQNKKELKETKKSDLKRIENFLREDNEKALMILEEGGQLERIIMQMYKHF